MKENIAFILIRSFDNSKLDSDNGSCNFLISIFVKQKLKFPGIDHEEKNVLVTIDLSQ